MPPKMILNISFKGIETDPKLKFKKAKANRETISIQKYLIFVLFEFN